MLYGNQGSAQSDPYADAAPMAPEEESKPDMQEEKGEEATAVIPKALLAGKEWKPGEEIVLQIVQVNEDGAVVKYASEKGGGEEYPEEAGGGEEKDNPGSMSSMMY